MFRRNRDFRGFAAPSIAVLGGLALGGVVVLAAALAMLFVDVVWPWLTFLLVEFGIRKG